VTIKRSLVLNSSAAFSLLLGRLLSRDVPLRHAAVQAACLPLGGGTPSPDPTPRPQPEMTTTGLTGRNRALTGTRHLRQDHPRKSTAISCGGAVEALAEKTLSIP
jgi:hypothetical protein